MKCCWVSSVYRQPGRCLCEEPVVEAWHRRVVQTPPPGFEKLLAFAPVLHFCEGHRLDGDERRRAVASFMSLEKHQASIHTSFQVEPVRS